MPCFCGVHLDALASSGKRERDPPAGRAGPTREPLGDVQCGRRRRRRARHLEQLAQHGVHARGHRARHLRARAPGRRRACLRGRARARRSLPRKVEPELTSLGSTVCCGVAGRPAIEPALAGGLAAGGMALLELNHQAVAARARGPAVFPRRHAVPAGCSAPPQAGPGCQLIGLGSAGERAWANTSVMTLRWMVSSRRRKGSSISDSMNAMSASKLSVPAPGRARGVDRDSQLLHGSRAHMRCPVWGGPARKGARWPARLQT